MKELTAAAVQNRQLLEHLAEHGAPDSISALAQALGRDKSNVSKSVKVLAAEGWLTEPPPGAPADFKLTLAAREALAGMAVAAGRLRAGLPPLAHAQIVPDPLQPRRDFEPTALAELSDSIGERGVLQPLLLRLTGPNSAVIVAGERRWRAIGQLIAKDDPRWPPSKPIPYHLSSERDEAEILVDQVVENLQRAGLHPLEEAEAFQTLKARGWGVGQISKSVGKTRKFVEVRLDLLNLPEKHKAQMRLAVDDPQHLTFTRAREILQHLRQINANAEAADAQRDLAEIPGADPEAARVAAIQLDPQQQLILGEVYAAGQDHRSIYFPGAAEASVAMFGDQQALDLAAEGLIHLHGNRAGGACAAELRPAGDAWLRRANLHPAQLDRNLFELRRNAGVSADKARLLATTGKFQTAWLNVEEAPARTPGGVKLSNAEILALVEIEERRRRGDDLCPENPRAVLIRRAYPYTTTGALTRSKLAELITTPGDRAGLVKTWIGVTPAGVEWLKANGLLPTGDVVAEVLARARAARDAWSPRPLGRDRGSVRGFDELATAWLNEPTEEEREQHTRYLERRDLEDLRKLPSTNPDRPSQPARSADDAPDLNDAEIRILRDLHHAQAANGGQPVRVGRYWLDLDAVGLWKRAEPMLTFAAPPGEGWRGALTDAGAAFVEALDPEEFDPLALELRIKREGRYTPDWLNAEIAEDDAQGDQGEGGDEHEQPETPDQAVFRQVLEGLQSDAPDFGRLFTLAGLAGDVRVHEATILSEQAEVATVDPFRSLPEGIADARAELVAYALRRLLEDEDDRRQPLFALYEGDVVSVGGAASGYRLLGVDREDGLSGPAFRAQGIRLGTGKNYGEPRTVTLHAMQRVISRGEG